MGSIQHKRPVRPSARRFVSFTLQLRPPRSRGQLTWATWSPLLYQMNYPRWTTVFTKITYSCSSRRTMGLRALKLWKLDRSGTMKLYIPVLAYSAARMIICPFHRSSLAVFVWQWSQFWNIPVYRYVLLYMYCRGQLPFTSHQRGYIPGWGVICGMT